MSRVAFCWSHLLEVLPDVNGRFLDLWSVLRFLCPWKASLGSPGQLRSVQFLEDLLIDVRSRDPLEFVLL